jgi:hypothetical protein
MKNAILKITAITPVPTLYEWAMLLLLAGYFKVFFACSFSHATNTVMTGFWAWALR